MDPKELIGHISGGKVLDAATGSGGFIRFLVENLKAFDEIIGIDNSERGAEAFAEAFQDRPHIRFQQMDVEQMDFPDETFDTVCIANSLHHLPNPKQALCEMKRVLRPCGTFIVSEMYRDNQTETQLTHVELHHWWAAVDTAVGIVHNQTYRREELVELVSGLDLSDLAFFDLSDLESDPKSPEIIRELNQIIDRYQERADGHPDLQARGEALHQRVQQIGFHGARTLFALGRKNDG
jgi:ubiquinone/menaquinone biosynthesis C-methylase UbiE